MSNRSRADTDDDEDEQFSKSTLGKRVIKSVILIVKYISNLFEDPLYNNDPDNAVPFVNS